MPVVVASKTQDALSNRYVPALDGVRGIAICAVLFVHSYTYITSALPRAAADAIGRVGEVGAFGVDLFFVLSGFLITGILVDARDSKHYFLNFYARRFLRLFPVYYGYLLFIAFVQPGLHHWTHTSIPDYDGNWWWYILYFCNWKPGNGVGDPGLGHFWSLAIEEQFYLVWPAIVLVFSRRFLALFCMALVVFSFGLRVAWASQDMYWNVLYRLTVTRLDTLALGALAALAVRSQTWRPWAVRYAGWIASAGLIAFAIVGAVSGTFSWEQKPIQTVGALAAAAGFAGLVLRTALSTPGRLHRFLISPVLTSFGKYSYGIYVYHMAIVVHCGWMASWMVHRTSPSMALPLGIATFCVSNILVYVIGRYSYQWFEKPILRYKDRFQD